eukprot:872328_1
MNAAICATNIPQNVPFSNSQCITTFSPCDSLTHSINITCQETDNLVIDSNNAAKSIINIPENIIPNNTQILNVKVSTTFQHTWVADLQAFLLHENKTTILFGNNGGEIGCSQNNVNVLLSDSSANLPFYDGITCDAGSYGIDGTHQPVTPLSVYNGLNANGNWYLYVFDFAGGDNGIFGEWSIILQLVSTYCTTSPTLYPTINPTTRQP